MRELGIFTDGTICAPATIPGTGAISIIRVSGEDSLAIADKVIDVKGESLSETEGYRLRYGTIFADDGSVLDNVIVSVFRAPHSYTGENSVEISCHASRFIVNEVLELLVNAGARIAAPGEFTRRAFVNGKMDLAQAEAVADVIASQSAAAHRVAMNQLKGGFSSELKTLREKLLTMTSLLELELDFSEEDVEFASRSELGSLVEETLTHIVRLTDSFSRGNAIKNGVPVAIVGATNTGKSTLLNALLGEERAIVSDIAGTTRDTIEEEVVIDGIRFRFIDTAGLRDTDDKLERMGIERSHKAIETAQVIIRMVEPTTKSAEVLADNETAAREIVVVNKIDTSEQRNIDGAIYISARENIGIDELRKALCDTIDTEGLYRGDVIVSNARHYDALSKAHDGIERAIAGLSDGISSEMLSEDIRTTIDALGEITGEITSDEILGNIFSKFCIGK